MCCFYWFINEAAFGQYFNRVKPGGKSKQICRERVGRVREKAMELLQETFARDSSGLDRTLPVGRNHVVIHR